MRNPSCEATISTSKEVKGMFEVDVNAIITTAPIEVKYAIAALILAIPRGTAAGELDDWECDLGDIIFPALSK